MGNGIDFAGSGAEDLGKSVDSTGGYASRGGKGPIDFAGDGAADVGGTIEDTSMDGPMPPKGDGVTFAGNGEDL